jgi:hypothetical protein
LWHAIENCLNFEQFPCHRSPDLHKIVRLRRILGQTYRPTSGSLTILCRSGSKTIKSIEIARAIKISFGRKSNFSHWICNVKFRFFIALKLIVVQLASYTLLEGVIKNMFNNFIFIFNKNYSVKFHPSHTKRQQI